MRSWVLMPQSILTDDSALLVETGDSWFNGQKIALPDGCLYEFQMQYGSIGWATGALLGYALALHQQKRVIALIGDGSFQLTAQEVSTMIRYGLNPIIFLLNNGGYTIEVEIHDGPYNNIKNWDYAGLVQVFNADGVRVQLKSELLWIDINEKELQMKKLEGKVAIITGSSRGIGKEIAMRLVHEGAKVVINYSRSPEKAEEVVNQIQQQGGEAIAIQADVSQVDQIQQLVTKAVEKYGQLNILVSNAGIEYFGKLEEITLQDFERVFSVNVAGQLFAVQAAARYLPSGGRIVLTSSVSAKIAVFYHTLYAASKAAVSAMVLNLAPELGERGITINAIAPGGTATDMAKENAKLYTPPSLQNVSPDALLKSQTSLQRLAKPEEIAAAVAFLVSDDASYISGSTLAVDGGGL